MVFDRSLVFVLVVSCPWSVVRGFWSAVTVNSRLFLSATDHCPLSTDHWLTQSIATMNTAAGTHTVELAATDTGRRRVGQSFGTFGAIGRAHLVRSLALGTGDFLGDALLLQVGLDLLG